MRRLTYLVMAIMLGLGILQKSLTHAVPDSPGVPAWASPSVMAIKRVSSLPASQHESNLLNNLDCQLLTYRFVADNTMQTRCFTETAFGLMDADTATVIFNGTDEGLPLLAYSVHEVVVPWPRAPVLIALDAANEGGSYISLYRSPLASLQDQRNSLLQLTAKQLTAAPNTILKDPAGKQLVVNPQTMAFSANGSWMAVETLGGSFVRINLATLEMTAFAQAFGSQGSPALLRSQVALSDDGRYAAIYNKTADALSVYDLATCSGPAIDLQPRNCASYDYQPYIRQQVAGLQTIRHVRFVNEGLLGFEAQGNETTSGIYELAPRSKITSLIDYLGLGDSYTSGEGAFDYLSGTDTADNMCHLSIHSYPILLTHDLFNESGGHSVACSGAEINDIGSRSDSYKGQVRNAGTLQQLQQSQSAFLSDIMTGYLPGYVAQQRFVQQYQPNITSVSIGGNDIGFGDILQKCVMPHIGLHLSNNTCYSTYEDRLEVTNLIDRTVPRWTSLYKEVLAEAPGTRLYAIGYPQIVDSTGNCALNVHLNRQELEFAEALTDYLNSRIRQAANDAGATYVDISRALVGHRLCEVAGYDVAVNGLTAGTDGAVLGVRVFGKESYHPNALGQALIEQAILRQTDNLTSAGGSNSGSSDEQLVLNAPGTGRTVNRVVPDDSISTYLVTGNSLVVKINGWRDGLKPNTAYHIRLDGPGGPLVGTVLSDADGNVSSSRSLPSGTGPGEHIIDVTGDNLLGETVDVTRPVYVPVADSDADGDEVPDTLDTCPGAVDSGQDSDRDGIDDSCDTLIVPPVAAGQDGSKGPAGNPPAGGGNTGQAAGGNGNSIAVTDQNTAGAVLPGQPSQGIAIFRISNSEQTTIPLPPEAERQGLRAAISRALGASTVNPVGAAGVNLDRPSKVPLTHPQQPFAGLYRVHWLLWAGLAIVIWLLFVLGFWFKQFWNAGNRTARIAA